MCEFKYFLILCCVFVGCRGFNLDTFNYVMQRGEARSMFGFSVATHKDRDSAWTIVGAPESMTRQPNVVQGGAVYRCQTDRDDSCQYIPFDNNGNHMDSSGKQIDMKSNQWFGATVNSGGPDKPIVACAPRYVWYSTSLNRRDPVGTCFLAKGDFTDFHEYSPCRTNKWGYHRQGACQAGLGAAVSKDGDTLFIGAPGSWYWQGQMYSLDPMVRHPYNARFGEYGSTGQAYGQNLTNRPSVYATKEGSPRDDDSYMGYSLAVGDFTGDGQTGVAIGMPRGNTGDRKLVGKVVLYTWNLTNHQNISGDQLGAYFGYSIASADIDGDGFDDIVIGAPLFTTEKSVKEKKYEVGRIYVRYQRNKEFRGRYQKLHTRDGTFSKGRFGLSVASLGDLDLDGYDDIAVGAPYAGERGRGVVYIYYGSKSGLRELPSQIIYAENVTQTHMYTFGFSVAGNNIDLDNNEYPDMVVGSYLSDTAVVFKSRPVIKVNSSVIFQMANKVINMEDRACSLRNGDRVICTEIRACFSYSGRGVGRSVELNVQYILDALKHRDPRMFFINSERQSSMNQTWRLEHQQLNCNSYVVYLKENLRDKLTPIEVEMRYSLKDEHRDLRSYRRSTTTVFPPMLSPNYPSSKDRITIPKNCGPDDICIPDLRLISQPNVNKYLLGSKKRLEIDVIVQNEGEDSFESMFYMKMPEKVDYYNIKMEEDSVGTPVTCSAPSEASNRTLKCDIGNPLPADRMVHFKVLLDPRQEEEMAPSYDFLMWVNSTNPEDNFTMNDNNKQLSINIWVETELSLTGWPKTPDLFYNSSNFTVVENFTREQDIGPQILHFYSIRNNGPSLIKEASALFLWPEETMSGDDLLYLMETETSDGITCEKSTVLNPLKVTMDARNFSYLESEVGIKIKKSVSSGSVSYGSGSHIQTTHRKQDESESNFDDGDGSFVHLNRSKAESSKAEGSKYEKTWSSSWNSSQSGSGPVESHSWNKTTVTGPDGVTRETQHSSSGGSRSKVYYTSSRGGAAQETASQSGEGAQFSVSGGQTFTQESQQGSTSQSGAHSQGEGHFDWNGVQGHRQNEIHRESHRGSTGHRQGSQESGREYHESSGGYRQTSGSGQEGREYHFETSGRSGQDAHHSSGHRQSSGSGQETGREFHRESSSGHRQTSGGGQEAGRESHRESSAGHRQTSGGGQEAGRESHRESSATHRQTSGGGQDVGRETHRESSGHRQTSDENRRTYGQDELYHGSSAQGSSGHGSSGYGRQTGTQQNATHKITWTLDRRRGETSQEDGGGMKVYNSFVTEESVNQGIDDYTQEVINQGKHSQESHQGSYGQESHQSRGEAHQARGENRGEVHSRGETHQSRGEVHSRGEAHGRGEVHRGETHQSRGEDHYNRGEVHHSRGETGEASGHQTGHQSGQSSERHRSTYGKYNNTPYDPSLGLGAAAAGGGFRTGLLDLGVHSTHGEENLSGHVDEYDSNYAYTSQETDLPIDPDLGSYEDNRNYGHSGVSYGTSRAYSGERSGERHHSRQGSEDRREQDRRTQSQTQRGGGQNSQESQYSRTYGTDRQGGSESGFSRTWETQGGSQGSRTYSSGGESRSESHSHRYSGDNVPTEYPQNIANRYQRHKRDANDLNDLNIHCNATHCKTLMCKVGPLLSNEEAYVVLRFRVNVQTLKKMGKSPVQLSSMLRARIDKLPYIGTPKIEERHIHAHEVFTNVIPTDTEPKVDVVPLWVVVLSACAGAIILLLLILLLYKCGFFKRNRPNDSAERQPLNRNGYHDEQL